jgi:hypothetical protein
MRMSRSLVLKRAAMSAIYRHQCMVEQIHPSPLPPLPTDCSAGLARRESSGQHHAEESTSASEPQIGQSALGDALPPRLHAEMVFCTPKLSDVIVDSGSRSGHRDWPMLRIPYTHDTICMVFVEKRCAMSEQPGHRVGTRNRNRNGAVNCRLARRKRRIHSPNSVTRRARGRPPMCKQKMHAYCGREMMD